MRSPSPLPTRPCRRRGLTLVEMLVTVALVLLIMVVITSVFRSAATVASRQKVSMEMEQTLRRFDSMLRQDLRGTTFQLQPARGPYLNSLPVARDEYAYFQPINPKDNLGYFEYGENSHADAQGEDADDYLAFTAKAPEGQPFRGFVVVASTQIVNGQPQLRYTRSPITSQFAEIIYFVRNGDLYRRVLLIVPERASSLTVGPLPGGAYIAQVINGSLVPDPGQNQTVDNRTYFAVSWQAMNTISARPRPIASATATSTIPVPNTLGDLTNRENRFARPRFANDYFTGTAAGADGIPDDGNGNGIPDFYTSLYPNIAVGNDPNNIAFASGLPSRDVFAFPYLFPCDFSHAQTDRARLPDAVHLNDPANASVINHNPIPTSDAIDNLWLPGNTTLPNNNAATASNQATWWGFPTYEEMVSSNWNDPVKQVNLRNNTGQANGLSWAPRNGNQAWLPPMTTAYRSREQPFNDGNGGTTFVSPLWGLLGESDDLVLTGVRGFDVKAYDPIARQYVDLGYSNGLAGTTFAALSAFGHEGRIPPILFANNVGDQRLDSQWPTNPISGANFYVGDTANNTIRMRRVWDSWSTDYAFPPDTPYGNPFLGPLGGNRPVYPGYSAPYPATLTGIQVHIRITDPRNERVKVLTIRQDFTDKL